MRDSDKSVMNGNTDMIFTNTRKNVQIKSMRSLARHRDTREYFVEGKYGSSVNAIEAVNRI